MTSPDPVPQIALNDGRSIPQLGFGVWRLPEGETPSIVGTALGSGYRSIDTAAAYDNEAGVGRGLRETVVPRSDVFVTTKLWNDSQGYDATLRAFDQSPITPSSMGACCERPSFERIRGSSSRSGRPMAVINRRKIGSLLPAITT